MGVNGGDWVSMGTVRCQVGVRWGRFSLVSMGTVLFDNLEIQVVKKNRPQ